MPRHFAPSLLMAAVLLSSAAAKDLEMYFIDTEGGQATLVVSPSGQTLLIDAGYTGFGGATPTASPRPPRPRM